MAITERQLKDDSFDFELLDEFLSDIPDGQKLAAAAAVLQQRI